MLSSLIRACKLKNDRIFTRMPIQRPLLNVLLDSLDNLYNNQPFLKHLYKSLISTTYFGLLRIGEATASKHIVLAKDVHMAVNKKKLMLILHSSKMHLECDKPQCIKIHSTFTGTKLNLKSDNVRYCPFQLLRNYILFHESYVRDDEQFFVFRDRTPVSPSNFRTTLHRILTSSGF